jgi:hypothetical protein
MPKFKDGRRLLPDPNNEPDFYTISMLWPIPSNDVAKAESKNEGVSFGGQVGAEMLFAGNHVKSAESMQPAMANLAVTSNYNAVNTTANSVNNMASNAILNSSSSSSSNNVNNAALMQALLSLVNQASGAQMNSIFAAPAPARGPEPVSTPVPVPSVAPSQAVNPLSALLGSLLMQPQALQSAPYAMAPSANILSALLNSVGAGASNSSNTNNTSNVNGITNMGYNNGMNGVSGMNLAPTNNLSPAASATSNSTGDAVLLALLLQSQQKQQQPPPPQQQQAPIAQAAPPLASVNYNSQLQAQISQALAGVLQGSQPSHT